MHACRCILAVQHNPKWIAEPGCTKTLQRKRANHLPHTPYYHRTTHDTVRHAEPRRRPTKNTHSQRQPPLGPTTLEETGTRAYARTLDGPCWYGVANYARVCKRYTKRKNSRVEFADRDAEAHLRGARAHTQIVVLAPAKALGGARTPVAHRVRVLINYKQASHLIEFIVYRARRTLRSARWHTAIGWKMK